MNYFGPDCVNNAETRHPEPSWTTIPEFHTSSPFYEYEYDRELLANPTLGPATSYRDEISDLEDEIDLWHDPIVANRHRSDDLHIHDSDRRLTAPELQAPCGMQSNMHHLARSHVPTMDIMPQDAYMLQRDDFHAPAQVPELRHCPLVLDSRIHATSPQLERGANPRNGHGIRLKPVSSLPDIYRGIFKFGVFNAMQSRCFDQVMHSNDNIVISAPTGSGKTVLFELALIRIFQDQDRPLTKAIYVAPTKALCSERYRDWSSKFSMLGIKCCELTGDTIPTGRNPWGDAKTSRVIITTPEKLDSLTRQWDDFGDTMNSFSLLLVDEVHILNETRGSTLEVVISRMKARNHMIRFLLVSATVPNVEDVAAWIASETPQPAIVQQFGEEFRPCRLSKFVYAFPRKGQNEYQFSRTLDFRLFGILENHVEEKPVLIFVSTRKGVATTAEQLKKDFDQTIKERRSAPWKRPAGTQLLFKDKHAQELASYGIGIHHAGLNIEDRRLTETLYSQRALPVLIATSTLAVGVNLPAHTVVIKGTKLWVEGSWKEYSDLDIMQMMGRAGRPQFDNEGVAIVLSDLEEERKYKDLVSGKTRLESSLHLNLTEHLNSEIGLTTISDISSAQRWLRSTFLYQRIQKNPAYYGLGKETTQSWLGRLDEIVSQSVQDLERSNLLKTRGEKEGFTCTKYGEIMSKYYIHFPTMISLLNLPSKPSTRDLLEAIANANEFRDVRLRSGDKQLYNKIREDEAIRYQVRKVAGASDKVFILLQAILGGVSLNAPEYRSSDSQPHLEAVSVFKHACRIARVIAEIAIIKEDGCQLKHGMELVRSLSGKAWEDRPVVLRQLDKLGDKSIKVLAINGISSISILSQQEPSRIEMLLNRNPPFGYELISAVRELPQYEVTIQELSTDTSSGMKPVETSLQIKCALKPQLRKEGLATPNKRRGTFLGMTTILTTTSDLDLIDFRRIPTKALYEGRTFRVSATMCKPSQSICVQVAPDNFSGLAIQETYKPKIDPKEFPTKNTRPPNALDVDLQILEDDPDFWNVDIEKEIAEDHQDFGLPLPATECVATPTHDVIQSPSKSHHKIRSAGITSALKPFRLPNGNYLCKHACKDKTKCRHLCCHEGLPRPPRLPLHTSQGNQQDPEKQTGTNIQKHYRHLKSLHKSTTSSGKLQIQKPVQSNNFVDRKKRHRSPSPLQLVVSDDLSASETDDIPEPRELLRGRKEAISSYDGGGCEIARTRSPGQEIQSATSKVALDERPEKDLVPKPLPTLRVDKRRKIQDDLDIRPLKPIPNEGSNKELQLTGHKTKPLFIVSQGSDPPADIVISDKSDLDKFKGQSSPPTGAHQFPSKHTDKLSNQSRDIDYFHDQISELDAWLNSGAVETV